MMRYFEYESGTPWCESAHKYETLSLVCEFANTITNLPIIVLPLVNAFLLREYIQHVNGWVFVPHLLLTFNGIASTLYHATLSLFGQLVDELSLLWLINMCVMAYLPICKFCPDSVRKRITSVRYAVIALTAGISALCFLKPSANALALMTFSIPGLACIYHEGSKANLPEAEQFTARVFSLWILAMAFWFCDKIFCDFWLYLGTPYLHAVFHLLSSLAGYNLFVMLSFLDITRRSKDHEFQAQIRYFPGGTKVSGRFCFPYITLSSNEKDMNS
ncbi:Alkaline ceramidase [Aphelenchoides besseyi]|nr:Alkaline ceramidase [Aphelenchoides besseyi]